MSVTNSGRGLESTVLASQAKGICVDKIPHGMRHIGGGRTVPVPGPVDFMGTLAGRSLVFDAKQCARKTRFNLGDRTMVKPHQRERIIRHGEAGAIAGLLVEATAFGLYLWLDWRYLKHDVASIPWDDACWIELGDTAHAIRFDRLITPANGASDHE
jgi:hypothetical protein